eukprot:9504003-Pyramimonas_sp.AAC.2
MKDDRSWDKDMRLAKHVLLVHRDASEDAAASRARVGLSAAEAAASGGDKREASEPVFDLKRYIQYCRTRYSPCLNEAGAESLGREYVRIRDEQVTKTARACQDEAQRSSTVQHSTVCTDEHST